MRFIEASGKTVKDAIKQGLTELGCESSDVDIQVIEMGSPGLFGMFGKPAKVRLTVKENDSVDIEMPVFSLDQPSATGGKKADKKADKPAKAEKAPKQARPEKVEKAEPVEESEPVEEVAEDAPKAEKKRRRSRGSRHKSEGDSVETAEVKIEPIVAEPFVATPEEELSDTAKSARAFLSGLTEHMGVPAQIEVSDGEEQLRMVMSGENMSILIGRRGETLDAIQYLTSLNVNRAREDYLRVSLDTENYRAKREEALRKLAVRMAARCKKSGRRVALEPMNPYERRILHSALQSDPEVTTHSEGEEPYRRVIITLTDAD